MPGPLLNTFINPYNHPMSKALISPMLYSGEHRHREAYLTCEEVVHNCPKARFEPRSSGTKAHAANSPSYS